MKLFMRKTPKIEQIQDLGDSEILFRVKNGYGELNKKYCKDKNEEIKMTYFLGKTPLIMANTEYCPTCSVMIKLAEGRGIITEKIANILDNINKITTLEDGLDKIKPILSLLNDDYYVLKEIDLIPTDGEGNFFWNLNNKDTFYNASSYFYLNNYGSILTYPKFMVPSQGTNCYNYERVEYYRDKIRNGERLFGIAIELRGYMALLIDGHHKATAAYLEGQTLTCITILETYYYKKYNTEEECINYIGKNINLDNLNNRTEIRNYYKNKKTDKINKYNNLDLEDKYNKPINIKKIEGIFPSYEEFVLSSLAKDISEKKIEELLNFIGEDPLEEIKFIFYKLKINNIERAKKLSFEILSLEEFQSIWDIFIEFLSCYKIHEVEDLFINILVKYDNYNCLNYSKVKWIIDNYLKID